MEPFEIERQIATGASSTVFRARNTRSGQLVALKVFHPQLVADREFRERLEREADALKHLVHPNVVRLIDTWKTGDRFFLELELVDGETLKTWAEAHPGDWLEPRIFILAQIARALGAVHEQDILHRDLKPDNVLISRRGEVKLTDFGLARSDRFQKQLTQTGSLVGSLAYMAPEAIEGRKASFATDIFSFGVLAYELLCGRHPFENEQGQLVTQNLLAVSYTSCARYPKVPKVIAQMVDQCLNRNENERPSSIWAVEAQLMELLHGSGQLRLAKSWLAESTPSLLAEGLQAKNALLKANIRGAISTPGLRESALQKLAELHALFPHDGELAELMSLMTPSVPAAPTSLSRWVLLACVPIIVFTVGFGIWIGSPHHEVPQSPTLQSAILSPPAPPAAKVVTAKSLPKATPSAHLKVLVDPDVRVFVDGRRVRGSDLESLKLSPGEHDLRLEKPGFDAIERKVRVRAGNTTTVNARTQE